MYGKSGWDDGDKIHTSPVPLDQRFSTYVVTSKGSTYRLGEQKPEGNDETADDPMEQSASPEPGSNADITSLPSSKLAAFTGTQLKALMQALGWGASGSKGVLIKRLETKAAKGAPLSVTHASFARNLTPSLCVLRLTSGPLRDPARMGTPSYRRKRRWQRFRAADAPY